MSDRRALTYYHKFAGTDPSVLQTSGGRLQCVAPRHALNAQNANYLAGLLHWITADGPEAAAAKDQKTPATWFGIGRAIRMFELDAPTDVLGRAFTEDEPRNEFAVVVLEDADSLDGKDPTLHNAPSLAGSPDAIVEHHECVPPFVQFARNPRTVAGDKKAENQRLSYAPPLRLEDKVADPDVQIFVVHTDWNVTRKRWTDWLIRIRRFMSARIENKQPNTLVVCWEPSGWSDQAGRRTYSHRFVDSTRDADEEPSWTVLTQTWPRTRHTSVDTFEWGPMQFVLYYGSSEGQASVEYFRSMCRSFTPGHHNVNSIGSLVPVIDEKTNSLSWKTQGFGAIHYGGELKPAVPPPLDPPEEYSARPQVFATEPERLRVLRQKFAGLHSAEEAAMLWAPSLPPDLNLRAALSRLELGFVLRATQLTAERILGQKLADTRVMDVLELNPKLPILQWLCETTPDQFRYRRTDVASIEPSRVWTWNQSDVKAADLDHVGDQLRHGFQPKGAVPTTTACVVNLDWGRRILQTRGGQQVLQLPFAEKNSLPQLFKLFRKLATAAQQTETKRAEDASLCLAVVPLPALQRGVEFLAPDAKNSGMAIERYRRKFVFASHIRRLVQSLLKGEAPGQLKPLPPHARVEIITTRQKSYLVLAISNLVPDEKKEDWPRRMSELSEFTFQLQQEESALSFTTTTPTPRTQGGTPPPRPQAPRIWFEPNSTMTRSLNSAVAVLARSERKTAGPSTFLSRGMSWADITEEEERTPAFGLGRRTASAAAPPVSAPVPVNANPFVVAMIARVQAVRAANQSVMPA